MKQVCPNSESQLLVHRQALQELFATLDVFWTSLNGPMTFFEIFVFANGVEKFSYPFLWNLIYQYSFIRAQM